MYAEIEPNARKIPTNLKTLCKGRNEKNSNILNISYLNKDNCKNKLRAYAINNDLTFFKINPVSFGRSAKELFENFQTSDQDLYTKIPLQINALSGDLTAATGKVYLKSRKYNFS